MTTATLHVTLKAAWWLKPYLAVLCAWHVIRGTEPEWDRVKKVLHMGLKIESKDYKLKRVPPVKLRAKAFTQLGPASYAAFTRDTGLEDGQWPNLVNVLGIGNGLPFLLIETSPMGEEFNIKSAKYKQQNGPAELHIFASREDN